MLTPAYHPAFFSVLAKLFEHAFSFFKNDMGDLGIERILGVSGSGIAKLQEIRKTAGTVLDSLIKMKDHLDMIVKRSPSPADRLGVCDPGALFHQGLRVHLPSLRAVLLPGAQNLSHPTFGGMSLFFC